jgi:integrase
MINDRQINSAIKACTSETILRDGAAGRGTGTLMLIIRRTGAGVNASWFGQWKTDGKRYKKALGRYPDMSLRDARDCYALQVRAVLAAGKSPRVVVAVTERPTVQRLFDAYCDRMVADGKSSAAQVRHSLNQVAEFLGPNRPAGDVDASDVAAFLARVYGRGAAVYADRFRSYMSAAFNYGMKAAHDYRSDRRQDWGIKINPVTAVPKDTGVAKARDRALSAAEISQLWHATSGPGFALETAAAIRLLICCGQRVRETLRMDASEVDLASATWTMPAEKTKGGRLPHVVPLPDLALPTLRLLLQVRPTGLLMPISDMGICKALARWRETVGAEYFQPRDLRRTWKSRTHDAGVDRYTRDLIQQHAMGDTGSRHYDRADYMAQKRDAMAKWNVWLENCLQSTDG